MAKGSKLAVSRERLVDAARDINRAVPELDPQIDVTLSARRVADQLVEASELLREDDKVSAETRAVLTELTGSGDAAKARAEDAGDAEDANASAGDDAGTGAEAIAEKPASRSRNASKKAGANRSAAATGTNEAKTPRKQRSAVRQLGAFKPIRSGTSLHTILLSAHKGRTVPQIAADAGIREDQVRHRLRHVLGVNHGIDYAEDAESGRVKLVLPAGKTLDEVVLKAA